MARKVVYNVEGVALTKRGVPDNRHSRHLRGENENRPYMYYEVCHKPGDGRPWHVVGSNVDNGEHKIVSRHRLEAQAIKYAAQLRIKQPDRKPGVKALHKLGMPHK